MATLGDNVYDTDTMGEPATLDAYNMWYDPTWGVFKSRTQPSPGNHEYVNDNSASGYFTYFGASAHDPTKGYYSYDLGAWHIVVLNTNINPCTVIACDANSDQYTWLVQDLADHSSTQCTLAYFHHPLFSSTLGVPQETAVKPLWQAMYHGGVDVIVNGHQHNYERFAPQDPDGTAGATGIREFVVGVGGRSFKKFTSTVSPNSEKRIDDTFGILDLTLDATGYSWNLVPATVPNTGSQTDSGSGACQAGTRP